MFFHPFLPFGAADYLSYKIDPFFYWKVFHQNFHWPFFKRSTSPAGRGARGARSGQRQPATSRGLISAPPTIE
jgi:hypothetical protein